ncbi:hypothetical protein BRO54_1046 [Geobacillus proteiniphilus]|uniref:Uncharacterized protein n=1 Tax=Geobacillus proteiniphilus TaxID=860353 RepID=A0A1Q5T4U9_9BACL|nr:hypothetical protein BRO54_1046 [Geobacillus proteiniphilus]
MEKEKGKNVGASPRFLPLIPPHLDPFFLDFSMIPPLFLPLFFPHQEREMDCFFFQ